MNKTEIEKALKRYLKRSIGYSTAVLIGFLIDGQISLAAETNRELIIQDLLKDLQIEKNELQKKLLEVDKELSIVINSEDKSTHFLFSPKFEHRHSGKSHDNGFGKITGDEEQEKPNIDIPDIRDDVKPNVPNIPDPLPNEDNIVKEPEFEFQPVGEIAITKLPNDIDITIPTLNLPVEEIKDENFNNLTAENVVTPDVENIDLGNVNIPEINSEIGIQVNKPDSKQIEDLQFFVPPEVNPKVEGITSPESFSLGTVKIATGSFNQNTTIQDNAKTSNLYVVQNYNRYVAPKNNKDENGNSINEAGFNIWVAQNNINYDAKPSGNRKEKILTLYNSKGEKTELDLGGRYEGESGYIGSYSNSTTTTFINDSIGMDTSVEGDYSFTYEGSRDGVDTERYVKIFLSISSKGLKDKEIILNNETVKTDNTKLTELSGELHLATTNAKELENNIFYGNLVGIEHQIWDNDNTKNKNSILLNSGDINIGVSVKGEGDTEHEAKFKVNKNMIGIMIDSAESSTVNKEKQNQTINSGTINIIQETSTDPNIIIPPTQNNIGISFEEHGDNINNKNAVLRDEVYIGKINIGDGTTKNYGFSMGNIYQNSNIYFDDTLIYGKVEGDSITIENSDESRGDGFQSNIKDGKVSYTSDIVVAGTQNVGMVVGKSLSAGKNINPIANFKNISILVNGDQTIGFVRDKNYSDNNKNHMIITEDNLNNVRFGENAENSVLFRSEQYGINNNSTIDVTGAGNKNTENNFYNTVMQGMRQTWKNGNTEINSVGSVTNSGVIKGTVNNMVGMMASGEIKDNVKNWQNEQQIESETKANAVNTGTISLNGNRNIGMAVLDDNEGSNSGTISINYIEKNKNEAENSNEENKNTDGIGVYNTGKFTNSGTINAGGENGIGIYNKNTLDLDNTKINIQGNSTGIFSEGGIINFGRTNGTTIIGDSITGDNANTGIYIKGNPYSEEKITYLNENVNITGTKAGLVSHGGTVSFNGNLEYSGDGFALHIKDDENVKGKINFTETSTLILGGNAYGFNIIDDGRTDDSKEKNINLNGADIEIKSNNVTLFNINGNGHEYSSSEINSGDGKLPGEEYLEMYVGEIGEIIVGKDADGKSYKGYKMASIEDGIINLNSTNGNNEEFLKKYKFQKSKVNMTADTNLSMSNSDIDTYFHGDMIGIGISSTSNIDKSENITGEKQREETQINIKDSTLTANRTEKAPEISAENKDTKSTIGAYIDFGNVTLTSGHIIVEKNDNSVKDDIVNDNGIGILAKDGSSVKIDKNSSVTVYGDNTVGILAESTKDENNDKENKFGGKITKLNIENHGDITLHGQSGIGIYADGSYAEKSREDKTQKNGTVINSGDITIGGGTSENSAIGIYGNNVKIENNGNITAVGENTEYSVGIYGENADIVLTGNQTMTLGSSSTGIYLDKDSSLTAENITLTLSSTGHTENITGIYAVGEENKNPDDVNINFDIDMADAVGGRAVTAENRNVILKENHIIKISSDDGRGMRAVNSEITNKGTINIVKDTETSEKNESHSSIGMVAADQNGIINNSGTITVNSNNGIGIFVDNSENNREGNKIISIGTIILNGDKNIGTALKGTDIILGENNLSISRIIFGQNTNNGVGIFADKNSSVTINEDITKKARGKNNILIAGIESTITNNKNITVTGNGGDNIAVYLGKGGEYKGSGSVNVKNGAIGIYSDKGAKELNNINISSDSHGVQTIGVVLNGENGEEKLISGTVTLKNENDNTVTGKNIGVYANNSDVAVNDKLTFNNEDSNGTGLYLYNSTLSGNGTIEIKGTGKEIKPNNDGTTEVTEGGKVPNSVGIYYKSDDQFHLEAENQVKVIINKSNTVGVYVADKNILTKAEGGEISIGTEKSVTNVTGILAGKGSVVNNFGNINLNNSGMSTGIAALGGTINNDGKITIGANSTSGTGIYLSGESNFNGANGTISIEKPAGKNDLDIGIYAKGEKVTIENTGNFDLAEGNTAVYSDGADISADINLADNISTINKEENNGTIALVVKSDKNIQGAKEGTSVGGTSEDKMNITLAKGSTGIYALDSGVKISNVKIDANANEKNKNLYSTGLYLSADSGTYNVNSAEIDLVKGIGIIIKEKDKNNIGTNTDLILTDSTLNINSYSEGNESDGTDSLETGIGIYTEGNISLNGSNTLNISNGIGIFGDADSTVTTAGENNINLQGYSVGIYSKGGTVNLNEGTSISFENSIKNPADKADYYKGAGAYIINGTINSSADITNGNSDKGIISQGTAGLLGQQISDTEVLIKNSGNINLSGNSVMGIAGFGKENSSKNITLENNGEITISGNEKSLSAGIYGENAFINNNGNINVGNNGAGIFYTGTKENNIYSNTVNLSGTNSLGVVLKGTAGDVEIENINGTGNNNLGVYFDDFTSTETTVGNITLGDESLGVYFDNTKDSESDTVITTETKINSLGNITVGTNGIGIASVGDIDKDGKKDSVTIGGTIGKISVGNNGTAIYVKDSNLNMDIGNLDNIQLGKDGVFAHINNGILNLAKTSDTLTISNGNIGILLENGGDIITQDESRLENLNISEGAVGIIVRGENTKRPTALAEQAVINLDSGVYAGKDEKGNDLYNYSVGVYFQNSDAISNPQNNFAFDIHFGNENNKDAHHMIGTIYDRSYGTINNYNEVIGDSVSYAIGNIIRRNNYNADTDKDEVKNSVTLNAENEKDLLNISGNYNIGVVGKNSVINANGNIIVGTAAESKNSIGVYLAGNDKNWEHKYTGNGNITVGNESMGIYAKNYDIVHTGNISASGTNSVGIASVIADDKNHGHTHTADINGNISAENGAIGIFGKDTKLVINSEELNVSGENSTGIANIGNGQTYFTGSSVNISGKGSAGIYMNSVDIPLTEPKTNNLLSNNITVEKGEWNISDTAIGIAAISREKNENGEITETGNTITVDNNAHMNLGDGAIGIYSAGKNHVFNSGDISVGGAKIENGKTLSSIGIYMVNGVGGKNPIVVGENSGKISALKNGGAGILVSGYVDFENNGDINVADGAEGIHVSLGAKAENNKTITVTGKGTGMIATGNNSLAVNNGTINLEKNKENSSENSKAETKFNTSLIGMMATNGGHIVNSETGIINVNDGIGMYVDKNSSFTNDGTINVNNGVGIMGVGELNNTGKIIINSENKNAFGTVELEENLSDKGSLVIDKENGILEVNKNFSNIGGVVETDYNIKLNNPTIDITAGGAGFVAPDISGDIKLNSNFILDGNGLSYSVEDFVDLGADINVNTSPLYKAEINEGDLTVNKVDYKDVISDSGLHNMGDEFDKILEQGGTDAEFLKNLNYYLDSLGNTTVFSNEAERFINAVGGGHIYSNVQSRMQDISRNFEQSFDELIEDPNPTYENMKYHLIYTEGDYKNPNKNVANYDYTVKGLNTMKEYDLSGQGIRYGYSFGFTGTEFKFNNSFGSEEDVYSLRGGAHRIKYYDNGVSWLSRGEIGYNQHRVERKVIIPNDKIENKDWYGSYQVSFDNKLRKELLNDDKNSFGVYTSLNLEYGMFDDIKENGNNMELKVKSNDYINSKIGVGVDGKYAKPINDEWTVRLNGDVGYSYNFGENYENNEARLRDSGSYYDLSSEEKSKDVVYGKASAAFDKSDYFSVVLHGGAYRDFNRDEDYWNAGVTFIIRFNNHAVPEKFLDIRNYFEFDKSDLKEKDKKIIKEMSKYMEENNMKGTLLIEGHTDDRGSKEYNQKLSEKRAESVKKEFEKNLADNKNIKFQTIGHGKEKPKFKDIDESSRAKNRRTEINILNK